VWLVVALAHVLVAVAVHLIGIRLPLGLRSVPLFVVVGLIVGGALGLTLLIVFGVSSQTFAGLMVYAFASELYLFFFTLVLSSVSVSILLRLRAGAADEADLIEMYSSEQMVLSRVERLATYGFLVPRGDGYAPTPRTRRLVRLYVVVRRLFGHERAASADPGPPASAAPD
jgi:hypothetical protein